MKLVYINEILKHLLITEIFELVAAYIIGIRKKQNIKLIFIVNVVTNITLNLFLIFIVRKQVLYLSGYTGIDIFTWYYIILLLLEIIIVFVEANIYYKKMKLDDRRVFYKQKNKHLVYIFISLILNLSSVLGGRLFD